MEVILCYYYIEKNQELYVKVELNLRRQLIMQPEGKVFRDVNI